MTQEEKNIDIESKTTPEPPNRFFCLQCGHNWISRKPQNISKDSNNPLACPRCKSYRWNERKRKKRGGSE